MGCECWLCLFQVVWAWGSLSFSFFICKTKIRLALISWQWLLSKRIHVNTLAQCLIDHILKMRKQKQYFGKDPVNRTSSLKKSSFCSVLFSLTAVGAKSRPDYRTWLHWANLLLEKWEKEIKDILLQSSVMNIIHFTVRRKYFLWKSIWPSWAIKREGWAGRAPLPFNFVFS